MGQERVWGGSAVLAALALAGFLGAAAPAVARPAPPLDPAVAAEFAAVEGFVASLPDALLVRGQRTSLLAKLEQAESRWRGGKPCVAVQVLGAFSHEVRALGAAGFPLAEELANDGRHLTQTLRQSLPPAEPCAETRPADAPPEAEIVASSNEEIAAATTFGPARLTTAWVGGVSYTRVAVPGVPDGIGTPGLPAVPVWRHLIAVPRGAVVTIELGVPEIAERIVGVNLWPTQPEPEDDLGPSEFVDPPFTMDAAAYASDALFPSSIAKVTPIGTTRDLVVAEVEIAAGQYNPLGHDLTLFGRVPWRARFSGGTGNFVTERALDPFEHVPGGLDETVLNEAQVYEYVEFDPALEFPIAGEELLIVTTQSLEGAANLLRDWKEEKGIMTTVLVVDSGLTAEEVDEKIEFHYALARIRPSYLLLLGDVDSIPTWYVSSADTPEDPPGCSDPMASDWNYGFVGGQFSYLQDMAVGRIPVFWYSEAARVVRKVIAYESRPPDVPSFYENVSIAAAFQCCQTFEITPAASRNLTAAQIRERYHGWDQRSFLETSEYVRDMLLAEGYEVQRIYQETVDQGDGTEDDPGYSGNTTPRRYYDGTELPADLGPESTFPWGRSGSLLTQDILDAVNEGRFLLLHRDHGSIQGMGRPSFSVGDVYDLDNGDLQPVVFSVNCASGFFDSETAGGECGAEATYRYFSEILLLQQDGAVGILGDTRNSPTWSNNALTLGFFDAIWPETLADYGGATSYRRLGDILNYGKQYLLARAIGDAGSPVSGAKVSDIGTEMYIWHVIGDPTLEMWTQNPNLHLLPAPVQVAFEADGLVASYAAEGAQITVSQRTPEGVRPIGRATVQDGQARVRYVNTPVAGVPLRYSASRPNHVSRRLDPGGEAVALTDESAFGPEATRLTFEASEGCFPNDIITDHYAAFGVTFLDDGVRTPLIIGPWNRPGTATQSGDFSLLNNNDAPMTSENVPLVISFSTARQKVGVYIGAGDGTFPARLTAYGSDGGEIFTATLAGFDGNVTNFLGLDAGSARVVEVRLDYGNEVHAETVDDLLFE